MRKHIQFKMNSSKIALLTSIQALALASSPALSEEIQTPKHLNYSLTLSIENGGISTTLRNESQTEFKIRNDEMPASLLIRGINLYAFSDSDNLAMIPMGLPLGSDPRIITVPPQAQVTEKIHIRHRISNYCKILEKNPILIFWTYSAMSGKDVLFPTTGVVRIKLEQSACK